MTKNQSIKSVHLRIEGRVQGVWYRGWAVETAKSMELNGWVRNRLDGTVEAVFSGPEELVINMVEACHTGPTTARVTNVKASDCPPPEASGFIQLSTN